MGVDQTTIDGDAKLLGVRKGAKCESSKFTISTILLTYIAAMYTSARALLLVQNDFFFRQSHQLELAALTKRADVFATKRARFTWSRVRPACTPTDLDFHNRVADFIMDYPTFLHSDKFHCRRRAERLN